MGGGRLWRRDARSRALIQPMTATVLLIRHGDHDEVGRVLSGRSEIGLNAAGQAAAEALARRLRGRGITAIQSSPRRRAVETAGALAALLTLPLEIAPALDEIDFGAWTGRSFASLAGDPAWDRWNANRASARVPGGETMTEAVVRAAAHLEGIAAESVVACVTHCDIIRGLVARHLGLSADRILDFDCDPTSVTTLAIAPHGSRLLRLNARE